MTNTNSRQKLWKTRFESGLCIYCGENPFQDGKKGCSSCLKDKYKNQKKYLKNHPTVQREYNLRIRKEVLEKYGNQCKCCGENNWALLVIDHINDDGYQERKDLYGSQNGAAQQFFLKLRKEKIRSDLQVLCWNCNAAKSLYGCCPHNPNWIEPEFSNLDLRRTSKHFDQNTKIVWPSDQELLNMIFETNCSSVANQLGVHDTAIRGRLKRRNLYQRVVDHVKEKRNKKKI